MSRNGKKKARKLSRQQARYLAHLAIARNAEEGDFEAATGYLRALGELLEWGRPIALAHPQYAGQSKDWNALFDQAKTDMGLADKLADLCMKLNEPSGKQSVADTSDADTSDVGLKAIEFVYQKMNVDSGWSVRKPREFTWWGGRIAQRVWADPVRDEPELQLSKVHAEVIVLRDVPVDAANLGYVSSLNRSARLSAFLLDEQDGTLRLHSKVHVHQQNVSWTSRLLMTATGLQASLAHRTAEKLARKFGGEVAESSHPLNGVREEPDELLGIVDEFRQVDTRFDAADFATIEQLSAQRLVVCFSSDASLVAEFPYAGPPPRGSSKPLTSLFKITLAVEDKVLGSGCGVQLRLPHAHHPDRTANRLNLLESRKDTQNHFLGAWHPHKPVIAFSTFLPSMVQSKGLLVNLYFGALLRNQWAGTILSSSAGPPKRQRPSPDE